METSIPLRKTLAQFLQTQTQPPPPPPTPTPTLPNFPIEPGNQPLDWVLQIEQPIEQPPDLVLPIEHPLPLPNAQQQQQQKNSFDFPTLVLAFCLTSAVEIAIQERSVNPLIFHLLCLMVVFAFASIFVAKYIAPKHPNAANKLDNVGVFFGFTAFFLAVTIPFPLCLQIISWITYGLSLLAILICHAYS
ncbi:hypothetical protein Vadar_020774 [Vaccinium darrowii]|uniref:Uncharacterized protein n=1 Tax=Vaccinium darrowii TaxID=229202 RepID=A0ACB7YX88_9ERIC|nr:hypothetical protein Vadar_020774 [Vaccinium darrowii]